MRMFRLSSWISESRGCDKVANGDVDSKIANATRPVVEILRPGYAKRKRSESVEASDLTVEEVQDFKRRKMDIPQDPIAQDPIAQAGQPDFDAELNIKKETVVDGSRLRETLESQFSLEILLKHNELRLINQELAKCQVALEQLRRCHLIPYPTSQGTMDSMFDITNGTGPAVGYDGHVPQWAPAFGVTDGPYSRHYAKWLIPDPNFDGVQVEWHRGSEGSRAGKSTMEGRSTRYSFAEGMSSVNKARTHRGSGTQKLQALSSGYPQAKEKVGPCVLTRRDGQRVKLVCIDCNRDNFSSTQGFINHCRIAHKRDFKSHEEAAVVSGQPYDADEAGSAVVESKSPPAAAAATGLVHPLILSTPVNKDAYTALLSRIDASLAQFKQGNLPGVTSIPTSNNSTPVKAGQSKPATTALVTSAETPYLSSLMHRKGLGGDLSASVSDAKTKIDLDDLSSHDDDSEDSERNVTTPTRYLGGLDGADSPPVMRVPTRTAMSPTPFGRPGSSKGPDTKHGRKPGISGISPRLSYATPVLGTSTASSHMGSSGGAVNHASVNIDHSQEADVDLEMMDGPSITELSPHTIASNNAPSLVSDDGEYEDGDDAESASSDAEDDDSVAEIDIEDDGIEKVVPRTILRNRAGSGGEKSMRMRKEDKQVTFVSPVKESTKERRRK